MCVVDIEEEYFSLLQAQRTDQLNPKTICMPLLLSVQKVCM